jgi:hypothetical protein
VRDILFVALTSSNNSHVISCYNLQTRQLNVLDFSLKVRIRNINWFEKGNLIIHAEPENSEKYDFYKIAFG